jgi:type II secretion system protein N
MNAFFNRFMPSIKALGSLRTIRLAGYVLFGLFCFVVLFVWTFPYQALERRIEAEASRAVQRPVSLENLGYGFPFGLDFDTLTIDLPPNMADGPLVCRDGLIKPGLLSMFLGQMRAKAVGRCFQGSIRSTARFSPLLSPKRYSLAFEWEAIQLEELPIATAISGLNKATGSSSGDAGLDGTLGASLPETGSGSLRLNESAVSLTTSMGRHISLKDLTGQLSWRLQQNQLQIEQTELSSSGLKLDLSGSVQLNRPLTESRLNLGGEITFSKARPDLYSMARQMLPSATAGFRIRGNLSQPRTSLSR